jgi:NAD(P)-dependent dehydrogenase (short-subunit alcohol dehydrogenase family)
MDQHPALSPGRTAIVTGAASGIGRAAAHRFAELGLSVWLSDLPGPALDEAVAAIKAGGGQAVAAPVDVSQPGEMERLAREVTERSGDIAVLMNNAGIGLDGSFASPLETWHRIIDVNLWGVIHGVKAFLPAMLAANRPALIVNTGSKQGITTPPGNTPYNVSKAALKVFTEALAHDLRGRDGCRVTAHLLIPGYVFTGMTRAPGATDKPAAAWTPEQTVGFMLDSAARGDFYILCPDNDVDRPTDEKRILWSTGDIVENRPALSRWHPDYKDAFATYMQG